MNNIWPLVSVVITTKNEEKNIENCLKSIHNQSYSQEKIEVIVVDNNSTDKTKEIASSFCHSREGGNLEKLNLKLFNWGPERSAQRNFGVEKSNGEWFLYLDADMILSENVIKDCVEKVFVIPAKAGIQSNNIIALHISEIIMGEKFWSKVRRFERSFYDGTAIDGARFIKKSEFQKVGGFDEKLTGPEDWDLDKKLKKNGRIDLVETPIYHNEAEFDLKKYLNKKGYYAQKFDEYIVKWSQLPDGKGIKAKKDPDIKKQFGIYYRFFGVFVENGKWKKIITHPILTGGMFTLRFLVGLKYIARKNENS